MGQAVQGKDKKDKVHPVTGHKGPEREYMYGSTLSLISALYGVGGQRHAPDTLPPGEIRTHCIGGWVDTRTGLDRCGKTRPHRDLNLDRPARSELLYRLSYPGPRQAVQVNLKLLIKGPSFFICIWAVLKIPNNNSKGNIRNLVQLNQLQYLSYIDLLQSLSWNLGTNCTYFR